MRDKSEIKDHNKFTNNTKMMTLRFGISSLIGLGLNRITTNINILPIMIYFRWPLRFIIFSFPNLLFLPAHH